METKLLSVKEAAKILGVCESTVRNLALRGEFPVVRFSSRGVRIEERVLDAFIGKIREGVVK
jgi:excisionase family DNA binding protein